MKVFFIKLWATGFFSGYIKPFSGTWGTIPAWLIAWFLLKGDLLFVTIATVITFFISWISASAAEKFMGHDSRSIVIDEWAGMFIALVFIPHTIELYSAAFILFRILDVLKIYPARSAESLPGGLGVTMDDIVAGVQTNIILQIAIIYLGLSLT